MHVVIRRWSQGAALAEALLAREAEVQEILTSVPGFIAYYALRDGDSVSTISVCDDQAGTTESTQRAGAWVREHLSHIAMAPPEITAGETFLQF